jgi:hypothetical protein
VRQGVRSAIPHISRVRAPASCAASPPAPAPVSWWCRSFVSLASAAPDHDRMAPGSSRPARPCRCRCRTPGPGTAARRSPLAPVPHLTSPSWTANLPGGTARGTGGQAEESDPRARSGNERPLGRPAPGVRLIRGLNRTKKETTSRAVPPPFFTPVRRRASGTPGLIRRFLSRHPASFRSVRGLGLVSSGCPGGSGALEDCSSRGSQRGSRLMTA